MQFTTKNLALLAGAASLTSALPTTMNTVAKRGFNAAGSNNLAVWWGNSNKLTPLSDICKDTSSDIVILTFATGFAGGKWTLAGNTASASDIKACQAAGKKVFMSIGGETGALTWASADAATTAAKAAADQFYTQMGLDGIDLDIENKQPAHWDDFAKALKTSGKLISAAPQCPSPDASLPFSVLDQVDMTWVQFYNNPGCGHGSSGFMDSVKDWSAKTKGKLYIAGPGSADSAGSGYLDAAAIAKEIAQVQALGLKNFGGYALWDASTAKANGDYGAAVKKALGGGSAPAAHVAGSSSSAAPAVPTTVVGGKGEGSAVPTATGSPATGGAVTVQATSTAVVTSTAFVPSATAPAAATSAAATPAAPAAPTGGASSGTSCSADGALVCSADGSQFGICSGGQATMMAVSAGTKCSGGSIVAASS